MNKNTANNYYTNFKRLMTESGCNDKSNLFVCLKSQKVINYIHDKYMDSPNTMHTYLTSILAVIDNIKEFNELREPYFEVWNKAKNEKQQFNIQRQLTEKVEKFSSIKKRIENEFSSTSDEVLMINLYNEITPRNDFDDLSFNTEDLNHIDLDDGTITLKQFNKTNKSYDPIINFELSKTFMDLLKKSLKINPRNTVFTKQMRSIFRKANVGVNQLRHSKISEELKGENIKSKEKREKLKERMLHSSATQLQYIRSLKD